jgi:soluble lytic murein transglycosylase-like protein
MVEMTGWAEEDLRRQFQRAKKNGWLQTFKKAAEKYDFPPEVLLAIASRETNMRNIIGDGGHGYGIMQIDDRSFPEWCHSGL